jgi:hypothetical protein
MDKFENRLHAASDAVLVVLENLLAFRVVFSYLGVQTTLIHKITDIFLMPFAFLKSRLTFTVDSSALELVSVFLVFALILLHRYLDRRSNLDEGTFIEGGG